MGGTFSPAPSGLEIFTPLTQGVALGYHMPPRWGLTRSARGGRGPLSFAGSTGQFEIADNRSPEEIAALIRRLGYEPVWKDWDAALSA